MIPLESTLSVWQDGLRTTFELEFGQLHVVHEGSLRSRVTPVDLFNWLSAETAACQIHLGPSYHRPKPLRLVVHHIQPQGMGGLDEANNWVITCDTGHYNMHRLMGILLHVDGGAGRPEVRQLATADGGTISERRYAQLGYARWVAAGRPGRPVYEFA